MKSSVMAAMAVSGIAVLIASVASGFVGWMAWALALNGFMGQQRAVDTSMAVYIVLAVVSAFLAVLLSVLAVYYLSAKRGWNAAGSSALSVTVFAVATFALHFASVIISAVVAGQMRINQ